LNFATAIVFFFFFVCFGSDKIVPVCGLQSNGSTKESSVVNMVLTAVHVAFILFIIVIGLVHGDARNLTRPADPSRNPGGFFPHGAMGVFNGAAMVYLSYIGYDAVSTMAEEVERPARDIPIGVSGSVVVVTVLYCLMAASMSMLLPYDAVRVRLPVLFTYAKHCRMPRGPASVKIIPPMRFQDGHTTFYYRGRRRSSSHLYALASRERKF
jgi:amino acid transporter